MMIIIPECVKTKVDKLIAEYEKILKRGEAIYAQVTWNGVDYFGADTTKCHLEILRQFRKDLDEQKSSLYSESEEEIQRQIYLRVCDFFEPLSCKAIEEVTHDVTVQKQLGKALRKAARNEEMGWEAKSLLAMIKDAKHSCWSQDDEHINRKIFKLVKTEEEFNRLFAPEQKGRVEELTPGEINPFKNIRVAFSAIPFRTQYRKKGIWRTYDFRRRHDRDFFDGAHKVFNFWNDVTETAIYYVYVPEK